MPTTGRSPHGSGPVRSPAGGSPDRSRSAAGRGSVVIELGVERGAWEPATDAGRGPVSRPRAVLTSLVLVLLLTVTGSAAPPGARLRTVFRVPTAPGDTFAVSGDAVLVARRRAGGGLVGYGLGTGRLRWQAPVFPPTSYAVRRLAGLLFVGERSGSGGGTRSAAVLADSGVVLWRRPGRIVPVEGAAVVLAVSDVAGFFGAGRRIEGEVTALDPRTGRERWSVPLPSQAVLQVVPGDRARILLVHDGGRAELREVTDGRPVAAVGLPGADYGPDNPTVSGDSVVLRHPTASGTAVTGYAAGTLARRWSRTENGQLETVRPCSPLLCLISRAGVRGVDPADGTSRWFRPQWRVGEARGGYLQTYGPSDGVVDLLGLAEPRTGRLVLDLRGWRLVPGAADTALLLSRVDRSTGRTVVAVADAGARTVRVLGALPTGTGDCRGGSGRLVCRSADGTVVGWSYPRTGGG